MNITTEAVGHIYGHGQWEKLRQWSPPMVTDKSTSHKYMLGTSYWSTDMTSTVKIVYEISVSVRDT